jgi:hypothetical protein
VPIAVSLFPVEGLRAEPHPPAAPSGATGARVSASAAGSSSSVAGSSSASEIDAIVCAKKASLSQGRADVFLSCGDGLRPGSYQVHATVLKDVLSMTFFVHAKEDVAESEKESDGHASEDAGVPRRRDLVAMSSGSEEEDELSGEDIDEYDDGDGFVVADDVIEYSSGAEDVTVLDDDDVSDDSEEGSDSNDNSDDDDSANDGSDDDGSDNDSDDDDSDDDSDSGVLSSSRHKRPRGNLGGGAAGRRNNARNNAKRRRQVVLLDDEDEED